MIDPRGSYPSATTFGRRIATWPDLNWPLAQRIVNEFLGNGCSVFIADGSSTFFIGLALIEARRSGAVTQATIWTNHLAVASEYALAASAGADFQGMQLFLAGGQVNADLMMTEGEAAESFTTAAARNASNVILSVTALFWDRGPVGLEQKSLQIKRMALRGAREGGANIIFVVDYPKMAQPFKRNMPLVYQRRQDWEEIRDSANTFIVTTTAPNPVAPYGVVVPLATATRYSVNFGPFKSGMSKQRVFVTNSILVTGLPKGFQRMAKQAMKKRLRVIP